MKIYVIMNCSDPDTCEPVCAFRDEQLAEDYCLGNGLLYWDEIELKDIDE